MEDMMKRATTPLVTLILLVAAACTSTENPSSGASSTGGGSPPVDPSGPGGAIVFNRAIPGAAAPAEGEEGAPHGIAVYRLDLDTGTEQQISEVWDFVNLSPDGSRFLGAKPIPDGRIGTEIFDVDGSNHVLLPIPDPTLQIPAGSWSRDGKWIVTTGWDDTDPSRGGLYAYRSSDGGGLVRLTHPASPPNDYAVAYSPAGSSVLFIREKEPYDHSGPMNVFVVRKDGSGLVRLNPPGTSSLLEGQSWSPDSRQVAFVASRDGHSGSAVFVVKVDGTHARRITPWNVTLKAEWSPDGQWIAFDKAESEPIPRDLFVVHPDGTGLRQITSNEDNKMSFAPTWSSDSETLLFIRREYTAGVTDLWTVNVDGTKFTQVTHLPAEYSGYRWLPSTG
jgi:Tol biopolymer transport system component